MHRVPRNPRPGRPWPGVGGSNSSNQRAIMDRTSLQISGMSCGHCVGSVEKALKTLDGIEGASVTIGAADVTYDASRVTPADIARTVSDAGYAATVSGAR